MRRTPTFLFENNFGVFVWFAYFWSAFHIALFSLVDILICMQYEIDYSLILGLNVSLG